MFTSGATGPSKGVLYTHGALAAQRDAIAELYDITTEDRLVAAFAPFALYGPVLGIPSVVPDMDVTAPGTLTAAALGDAGGASTPRSSSHHLLHWPTSSAPPISSPPQHRAAFEQVRLLLSAGAPVRPTLLRGAPFAVPECRPPARPYGMTECLPVANISLDEIDGGDRRATGSASVHRCRRST